MKVAMLIVLLHYTLTLNVQADKFEYYSSVADVAKAADISKKLAFNLIEYVKLEESRLQRIFQIAHLLELKNFDAKLTTSLEEFAANPVNALLVLQRLSFISGSEVFNLRNTTSENEFNTERSTIEANINHYAALLPQAKDVNGAVEGLLLLQKTYKLKLEDLSNGKLFKNYSCSTLSASTCQLVGQVAYKNKDFPLAEEWFREAHRKFNKEKQESARSGKHSTLVEDIEADLKLEPKATRASVLNDLSYALGRQGRYIEALSYTNMVLDEDIHFNSALANKDWYENAIAKGEGISGPISRVPVLSKYDQEIENYEAVCRGEAILPPPPSSSVYCRFYVPTPYYIIGPVKEEVLYPDPKLVMWYDVIHDTEIDEIKQLATPQLKRALVIEKKTGKEINAVYRTSKSTWLPYNVTESTRRLKSRIRDLTGLSLETAEDLQVGNYGIGGYYAPHFDFFSKEAARIFGEKKGNRIATIMFYLSNVAAGGGTAFHLAGTLLRPVKGAAAFWYNLQSNGARDFRTKHAGCPVLHGSKWVMNVWLRERGQEFHRPCEVGQDIEEVEEY